MYGRGNFCEFCCTLACFQSAFTELEKASRAATDKQEKSSKASRQEVRDYARSESEREREGGREGGSEREREREAWCGDVTSKVHTMYIQVYGDDSTFGPCC